jgi:dTDP-glucose 4,6-dehydratase/UDP-glucuronate decarboxylase
LAETAADIVNKDLAYICGNLKEEFGTMAGKRLLIVGGAGFLGYYLVQSVLHFNKTAAKPIRVTVYDNYIRGIPAWLSALEGTANLELVKHDISRPLPADIPDFQFIVHAGSIASPIYYKKYPIETMDANVNGLRSLLEYAKARKDKAGRVEGFLFYSSSEIYGDPTPAASPTAATSPARGRAPATTSPNGTGKPCASTSCSSTESPSRSPGPSTITAPVSRSRTPACFRISPATC